MAGGVLPVTQVREFVSQAVKDFGYKCWFPMRYHHAFADVIHDSDTDRRPIVLGVDVNRCRLLFGFAQWNRISFDYFDPVHIT